MHQMRFAKADTAIKEQGIKRDPLALRRTPGNRECQLIWLANNKIGKCVPWIQTGSQIVARCSIRRFTATGFGSLLQIVPASVFGDGRRSQFHLNLFYTAMFCPIFCAIFRSRNDPQPVRILATDTVSGKR